MFFSMFFPTKKKRTSEIVTMTIHDPWQDLDPGLRFWPRLGALAVDPPVPTAAPR